MLALGLIERGGGGVMGMAFGGREECRTLVNVSMVPRLDAIRYRRCVSCDVRAPMPPIAIRRCDATG